MIDKLKILHIMPHLGGGVGKALTSLIEGARGSNYVHSILLLENPAKKQFVNKIIALGADIHISSASHSDDKLILDADIIQLEWWNHPAIFKFFCERALPEIRLIVWCHISGLHTPIIPIKLVKSALYFLFTSGTSFKAKNIASMDNKSLLKLAVVSSGVGFLQRKGIKRVKNSDLNFGYMGSLNLSKLHPDIIDYLAKVPLNNFQLKIWGDDFYKDKLVSQCNDIGMPDLIDFKGYTTEPDKVLSSLDVFIYLLNPNHYGTAENVLLEAMSLGVIPIVLNNPAEMEIVKHGETGFIISNPAEFAAVIDYLVKNSDDRKRISQNAVTQIAEKYSPEIMSQRMSYFYQQAISKPKLTIDFRHSLGKTPYEWYLACQENKYDTSCKNKYYIKNIDLEESKGSLKHFLNYFPTDIRLNNLFKQFTLEI
ncbi:MAG: glycosyltransferase family 4 protein [Bacteroidota bacterium]